MAASITSITIHFDHPDLRLLAIISNSRTGFHIKDSSAPWQVTEFLPAHASAKIVLKVPHKAAINPSDINNENSEQNAKNTTGTINQIQTSANNSLQLPVKNRVFRGVVNPSNAPGF